MSIETERDRLSQAELLAWLNRDLQLTEMVTVYLSEEKGDHNHGIYCALIPSSQVEGSLSNPCWDMMHGHGLPGATIYTDDLGHRRIEYQRFGSWHCEPLVLDRYFHGMRPDYHELSEEFRLFHHLYHDRKLDQFIKIDDDGNETLVATVEPNRIQVRLKEIRQFAAIREMHLAIQFDCREHSTHTLEDLGLKEGGADHRDGLLCWRLYYGSFHGTSHSLQSFSRLLGKRLILPLPKEKSGFWGFAEEKPRKYVDFIIGVAEDGDEITHTSDPGTLANYFGANPGAPHYLTPVHFRKTVLDKYYQQPGKYKIGDSILWCGGLWNFTLDNHHDDQVCAWLGDLGRDLPYAEQLHWRSHNIPPVGTVSETFYRRQILAEFADTDRVELQFAEQYRLLSEACDQVLGWRLLLALSQNDMHYFQALRVPSGDEQKDFDDLVLGLAKILIDSVNEAKLTALIPADARLGLQGSIAMLEAAFAGCRVDGFTNHIKFLRELQALRSTGSAHRKGGKYKEIAARLGIDHQSLPTVFRGILVRSLEFLEYLTSAVRSNKLRPTAGTVASSGDGD